MKNKTNEITQQILARASVVAQNRVDEAVAPGKFDGTQKTYHANLREGCFWEEFLRMIGTRPS